MRQGCAPRFHFPDGIFRATLTMLLALVLAGTAVSAGSQDSAALRIGGLTFEPGTRGRFSLVLSETFAGAPVETPVEVVHGIGPGPVICLTGGVHGDEINGIEVVRQSLQRMDPALQRASAVGRHRQHPRLPARVTLSA